MFLMLQHILYQDTVWRRERGRNVPDAAAHTLPGHCVEERGREECSWCCSTYITRTLWRGGREGGRNVPDAAAHTLPGHCVKEREREECS